MIKHYNQTQIIKSAAYALGGLICCVLAYGFFHYLTVFLAYQINWNTSPLMPVGVGVLGLAVSWFSGYRMWKKEGGLFSYHESGLYHDVAGATTGSHVVDHYAHRVTGPAYVIGQICMAGSQFLLKALTLYGSRIDSTPQLESRLESVLAMLQTANKWQGLEDYPDWQTEILYLAQMELIDFSGYNGKPRFKAS